MIVFYRHFYIDPYEQAACSQWQDRDWEEYLNGHYRDYRDMGDDNPIILLKTETKEHSV